MRTTVTLEPDVEKQLRKAVRRSGQPFKQILNDALRHGLTPALRRTTAPFEQPVFDMGASLLDLTKAASLAAQLEDQEILTKSKDAPARR